MGDSRQSSTGSRRPAWAGPVPANRVGYNQCQSTLAGYCETGETSSRPCRPHLKSAFHHSNGSCGNGLGGSMRGLSHPKKVLAVADGRLTKCLLPVGINTT
ncbi:hypothetical protein GN956_G23112 [Arapaima gigas]